MCIQEIDNNIQRLLRSYLEGNNLLNTDVTQLVEAAQPFAANVGPLYRMQRSNEQYASGNCIEIESRQLMSVSSDCNAAVYAGFSFNHDTFTERPEAEFMHLIKFDSLLVLYSHAMLLSVINSPISSYDYQRTVKEAESIATLPTKTQAMIIESYHYNDCTKFKTDIDLTQFKI